jgi:hypothetical protein
MGQLFDEASQWQPNIESDYQIGTSLQFLNILLADENEMLWTLTGHKPSIKPCVVPDSSDHPRHVFGNAIRNSSTSEQIEDEHRNIKLMFL